jgi:hypothetical protein
VDFGQRERLDEVTGLHERGAVGGVLQELPLVDVDLKVSGGQRLHPVGVQIGEQLAHGRCGLVGHGDSCSAAGDQLSSFSIKNIDYCRMIFRARGAPGRSGPAPAVAAPAP